MMISAVYRLCMVKIWRPLYEIDPLVTSYNTFKRYDHQLQRDIFFATDCHQTTSSRSCDSFVSLKKDRQRFGKIINIFKHSHADKVRYIVRLQLYPVSEQHGRFYATQNTSIQSGLFFMEEISNPLVTAIDSDILWFLNV